MTLIVTTAGLSASLDAANKGIKLKIKKIGFGSAGYIPNKDQASLKAEFLRTEFTDSSISSNTLNMNIVFDDLNQVFDAKEVGYYLEDDTLFAVDSLNGAIISSKHKGSILTESFELVLSDNLIDSITVDVIGVSRATENNVGIAKIATVDEAFDVENDCDIVTPKKLHDVIDERVVNPNLFINGDFSVNQRFGLTGASLDIGSREYFADRWQLTTSSGQVAGLDLRHISNSIGTYIHIASKNHNGVAGFRQFIESSEGLMSLQGRLITVQSCFDSDMIGEVYIRASFLQISKGTIVPGTHGVDSDAVTIKTTETNNISITLALPKVTETTVKSSDVAIEIAFYFRKSSSDRNTPNGSVVVFNCKSEWGDTATPNTPDSPGVNLAKCQRFYNVGNSRGNLTAYSSRAGFFPTIYFSEMRSVPATKILASEFRIGGGAPQVVDVRANSSGRTYASFLAFPSSGQPDFNTTSGGYGSLAVELDAEI